MSEITSPYHPSPLCYTWFILRLKLLTKLTENFHTSCLIQSFMAISLLAGAPLSHAHEGRRAEWYSGKETGEEFSRSQLRRARVCSNESLLAGYMSIVQKAAKRGSITSRCLGKDSALQERKSSLKRRTELLRVLLKRLQPWKVKHDHTGIGIIRPLMRWNPRKRQQVKKKRDFFDEVSNNKNSNSASFLQPVVMMNTVHMYIRSASLSSGGCRFLVSCDHSDLTVFLKLINTSSSKTKEIIDMKVFGCLILR